MATGSSLLSWWNLVFFLPVAVAVLLLLVTSVLGLGDHGGDGAAGHDGGGGSDGHGDADDHPLADLLHVFGVGVLPLTPLLQTFFLVFGLFGLAANGALGVAQNPEGRLAGAALAALIGALLVLALVGALARRFLPEDGPATGTRDLIGRTGRVVYAVSEEGGTAQVRDPSGTLHQIAARVPSGHADLEAGSEVIVVSFDAGRGAFMVDENPFATNTG